ncbi:hypothetical protein KEM55_005601, partial [Ascosphaera atra]
YEAHELRDTDSEQYQGDGVLKAVHNVQDVLGPMLVEHGFDVVRDRERIDKFLCKQDGTPNKSRYGANAILGISMAVARAAAAGKELPLFEYIRQESYFATTWVLPTPFFNVINGGKHSGSPLVFQEFMIAPTGAKSFHEAIRMGCETYQALRALIVENFGMSAIGVGDEGGFSLPIRQPHEALDLLVEAVETAGYTGRFHFGIDPASSEFYQGEGKYNLGLKTDTPEIVSSEELAALYKDLIAKYPIRLLEDPFAADDEWESWAKLKQEVGDDVEIVGDDLLATNLERMRIAKEKNAVNGLLLKVNQIGTVSEAIEAARKALNNGWGVFLSHRSGETTDDFIADLAIGLGIGHFKSGAPCRGERVAKYNRVLDIAESSKRAGRNLTYAQDKFPHSLPIEAPLGNKGYFQVG